MHTRSGCSITNSGSFTGRILTPNCDVNAPGQPANAGCSIASSDPVSYGARFNANGGGVYAMEITTSAVTIWFFPRNAIPGDIHAGTPNPGSWPTPMARFQGACDIAAHIRQQKIVRYCLIVFPILISPASRCGMVANISSYNFAGFQHHVLW